MGKNMWHKMGASKGATGGGEGERFWVSEETEPLSFQPQSNNNQQKNQTSRAFRGNSPSPNDKLHIIFGDQENNKHIQPRMWLKECSIPRGSLQQQLKLIKN
jgi:hypothetical protein